MIASCNNDVLLWASSAHSSPLHTVPKKEKHPNMIHDSPYPEKEEERKRVFVRMGGKVPFSDHFSAMASSQTSTKRKRWSVEKRLIVLFLSLSLLFPLSPLPLWGKREKERSLAYTLY